VTLVFYDQYYYLVAYHDEEFKLRNYRVDKMEKVEKLDTDITPSDCAGDINYNLHPSKAFSMFYGKTEDVVLLCENSLSSSIVDRFGKVKMTERSDGYFTVKVSVQVSPTFFAWCFGFENKIKIIEPKRVVDAMKEHLLAQLELYNNNE